MIRPRRPWRAWGQARAPSSAREQPGRHHPGSEDQAARPRPRRFASAQEAVTDVVAVARSAVLLVEAYTGAMDPALRERIMLAVSRVNACRGCTRVHEGWALRAGVTRDELTAIGLDDLAELDAASRAAVVYATQRAERRFRSAVGADVEQAARQLLSPDRLEQVEAVARAMALANLTLNTLSSRVATAGPSASGHPVFARVWQILALRAMATGDRDRLLSGLSGDILEIGAGTGSNFRHYPATVRSVLAVEPEPHLRQQAEQAALLAPVSVTLVDGTAEALPAADSAYDGVIACLVLCSVTDQAQALAEARRVLRAGGQLRFYEHVVAHNRAGATVQRALDRSGLWPRLGAGCHLSHDTATAIQRAGFIIEESRRPSSVPLPHVSGVARKPPEAAGPPERAPDSARASIRS